MTALTDRELLVRARRGDASAAEAFGELVTRYQTGLRWVIFILRLNS